MAEKLYKKDQGGSLPLWAVHSLMLGASVIVSSSFTVGAAITRGLDPAVLILVRYVLAVLFFAPILVLRHGFTLPPLRQLCGYSAISAATVGFFWCMFESLRYTSALNTSIIFTLVPGISGIYSAVFLKERLGRPRLIALFLGMVGAVWVIFRGDIHRLLALDINYGDMIFLAGCFLMAAYTPLVKRIHRRESMVVMTFWVLATGVGWLLVLSLPRLAGVNWQGVAMRVWAGILYLAVFSTIVTFYLTHVSTLYLGPTRVMAYSYFYPAFVLLIDWALGHGLPPAVILPGVVVVTLATVVLQRGVAAKDPAGREEKQGLPKR
ncbi:MAG: DMT family transporter [Proteobacteria bacterium]|nr:DMT family transporter [Pseudomonadota bacterium]